MNLTKKIMYFIGAATIIIAAICVFFIYNIENKLRDTEFNRVIDRSIGTVEEFLNKKNQFHKLGLDIEMILRFSDLDNVNLNDGLDNEIEEKLQNFDDESNMYFLNSDAEVEKTLKEPGKYAGSGDFEEILKFLKENINNGQAEINQLFSTEKSQYIISMCPVKNEQKNYYFLILKTFDSKMYENSNNFSKYTKIGKLNEIDVNQCVKFNIKNMDVYIKYNDKQITSSIVMEAAGSGENVQITLSEPPQSMIIVKKNFSYLFAAVIALILLLASVIFIGVKKKIINRILKINSQLNQIEKSQNLKIRIIEEGNDEIYRLEKDINKLFEFLEKYSENLKFLSEHDSLTNLCNRRKIEDIAQEYVNEKKPFAIAFIDLDGFKGINDNYGHDIGDLLLCDISKKLSAYENEHITCGRLGGDEFIIIAQYEDTNKIRKIANEIIECLKKGVCINEYTLRLRASVGIAYYPQSAETVHKVIKDADKAMYYVKENGGNKYLIYNEDIFENLLNEKS